MNEASHELQATAYHEAGHAAVACFHLVPFRGVTIVPSKGSLGRLLHKNSPKWFRPDEGVTDRIFLLAQRHLITSFAGQLAETKFLGRRPSWGMQGDNQSATDMAFRLCGSQKTVEAYLHYCWCVSSDAVDTHWAWIEAVAAALLERQTLTFNEVREVIWPGTLALGAKLNRQAKQARA